MHQLRPWLSRFLAVSLLLALGGATALGQGFGPEAFGIPSRFGSAAPTTTRGLALGAVTTTLNDVQFANPAFLPLRPGPDVSVRYNRTTFDNCPDLTSLHANYVRPLRLGHSGFQVTWLDMDSSAGNTALLGLGPGPVPAALEMSETALVVDYGRRVGAKSTIGLSVLGFQRVDFSLVPPVGPKLMDLRAKADFGGRLGAVYEYQPGDYLGIIYNFAQHTVDASGLLLGGAASSPVYHDDLLSAGMSWHVNPRLLAVGEFHWGRIWRGAFREGTTALHYGVEYEALPGLALRVGQADSQLTCGAGYARGGWRVDYAFLQDWNNGAVGRLFGGSDTNSLQASCEW